MTKKACFTSGCMQKSISNHVTLISDPILHFTDNTDVSESNGLKFKFKNLKKVLKVLISLLYFYFFIIFVDKSICQMHTCNIYHLGTDVYELIRTGPSCSF